jgi:hypothetical protein
MENEKKYLFDNPKNIKRLLYFLYGSCALLFVLDFVIHRHVMHSWENLWGFYPLYGFVGCVVLVLIATWMRTFLMRSEDYYVNEGKTDIDENLSTDKTQNDKIGGPDVDA